jgi:spoIIIJ-associated protein
MSETDLASQSENYPDVIVSSLDIDVPSDATGVTAVPFDASADDSGQTDSDAPKSSRSTGTDLVREGDVAADYLESLLDILDLDGDLDMDVEGERAVVAIVGKGLGSLIGDKGETLEALQELTRLAVQREMGVRSRLMLDIGGFRAKRRAELAELGTEVSNRVAASGEPERLAAMSPFERKVVHDAVAAVSGVHSESEGEEPQRRVVVLPD